MSRRTAKEKLIFYDTIGDTYDAIMDSYDPERRLDIVFSRLVSAEELKGRRVLDVGCRTGWFSRGAGERGAHVAAVDVAIQMLKKVREECASALVVSDACASCFPSASFDIVITSECIEHTINPKQAIKEMHRVLNCGKGPEVTVKCQ